MKVLMLKELLRPVCQYRIAFTLAEVLITLGIIGVVAAMTLPSVITKYKKIQTVSQLKKTYSILNQALDQAKVVYGTDVNNWYVPEDSPNDMAAYFAETYLLPYLKVGGNCAKSDSSPCNYQLSTLSKNSPTGGYKMQGINSYPFILADGSIISLIAFPETTQDNRLRIQILIDINGKKAPNITGIDGFIIELGAFSTDKNKFLPYGYNKKNPRDIYIGNKVAEEGSSQIGCNLEYGSGANCFALIMYDGWQIKDDYPWR